MHRAKSFQFYCPSCSFYVDFEGFEHTFAVKTAGEWWVYWVFYWVLVLRCAHREPFLQPTRVLCVEVPSMVSSQSLSHYHQKYFEVVCRFRPWLSTPVYQPLQFNTLFHWSAMPLTFSFDSTAGWACRHTVGVHFYRRVPLLCLYFQPSSAMVDVSFTVLNATLRRQCDFSSSDWLRIAKATGLVVFRTKVLVVLKMIGALWHWAWCFSCRYISRPSPG